MCCYVHLKAERLRLGEASRAREDDQVVREQDRSRRRRYARATIRLRDMRASSVSLTIDQDAGRRVRRDKGFVQDDGLVRGCPHHQISDRLWPAVRGQAVQVRSNIGPESLVRADHVESRM